MNQKPKHTKINQALGLLCATAVFSAVTSQADTFWTGSTADWNTTNWNAGLPNSGLNAIVNNGGTVLIQAGDPDLQTFDIRAGQGGGSNGNGGAWNQTGGNVFCDSWFRMGVDGGTAGTYTFSAGNVTVSGETHIGENGNGHFIMHGGTFTANNWFVFARSGGNSDGFMDGGTINKNNNGNMQLGVGGVCNCGDVVTFTQIGGTINCQSEYQIATDNNSVICTNNIGGGAGPAVLNVGNWLAVGRFGGIGTLNLSNNAAVTKSGLNGGNLTIASGSSIGTVNQYSGSTFTNTATQSWIAENNQGTWNMYAGTTVLGVVHLTQNAGAVGTFNLTGGDLSATEITDNGGLGTLNLNGGTLHVGASPVNNWIHNVNGGVTIGAAGATIDSAGNSVTISQALVDNGGGNLTKTGNGTITMTGGNSYLGNTIVSGGKLIEGTAATVSSAVTVANTAGFGVNVLAANAQVFHSSLALSGAANTLDFVLGGFGNPGTGFQPLVVSGNLSISGVTTVNLNDQLPQVGIIPLLSYISRSGAGTFALGTLPAGVTATLVDDTVNKLVYINDSSTALLRWNGVVAGSAWDINISANWLDYNLNTPANFKTGAAVFFDDLATGSTVVNINTNVGPGSLVITNNNLAYTFTGTSNIVGATSLVKQGTNSLTINNTNTYTGATVISGGTVSISQIANGGLPSAIGSSANTPANLDLDGGTLSYTGPTATTDRGYLLTGSSTLDVQGNLTENGLVTPSAGATFTKTGNGTLTLQRAGANTLSAGGGTAAYLIQNGGVIMDGTAGGQVNNITGEIWVGGSTNSTGGNLILTNTTLNLSSWFTIARGSGTGGYTSTATMYNSKLNSQNMSFNYDNGVPNTLQTAIFTMNGNSTFTNNGVGNWCESSGGHSIITFNDSSVYVASAQHYVGQNPNSTGDVVIASSAKIVINSWFSIGSGGSTATVLLKNNASLTGVTDLNVNDVAAGTATLTAQDNTLVLANNMFVGKGPGSTGTYTISNTSSNYSNNGVTIGASNPDSTPASGPSVGTVNLNGGYLGVNLVQGQPANGSTTTFNFNGGVLAAHPPYFGGDFIFNLSAANVLVGGANIEIDNADVRGVPQQLLDGDGLGGGLTKLGTGALLLNGANTYTGPTTVSAGSLGGNGSVVGNVSITSAGTLAPSASAGINTFTIGGNVAVAGNIAVAVNETNTPATNDFVAVTGTLTTTGAGAVKVSNLGPTLNVGDRFVLFSQALSPSATANAMAVTGGGATWVNHLGTDGSIIVQSIIPAPSFGALGFLPNGSFQINATGTPGIGYHLWASTDVTLPRAQWTLVATGTVPLSGLLTVTDPNASNFPAGRYYIFSTP